MAYPVAYRNGASAPVNSGSQTNFRNPLSGSSGTRNLVAANDNALAAANDNIAGETFAGEAELIASRYGLRLGARLLARGIPILGAALLAYDLYQLWKLYASFGNAAPNMSGYHLVATCHAGSMYTDMFAWGTCASATVGADKNVGLHSKAPGHIYSYWGRVPYASPGFSAWKSGSHWARNTPTSATDSFKLAYPALESPQLKPNPFPRIAPETMPILVPVPTPWPVPYPLLPYIEDDLNSETGPKPTPRPQLGTAYVAGVEVPPEHRYERPPKRTKERKLMTGLPPGAGTALVNFLTESLDAVGDLYDAIPPELVKKTVKRKRYKGKDGKWHLAHVSTADKAKAVYENFADIPLGSAFNNILADQLGDQVYAYIAKSLQLGRRTAFDAVGADPGPGQLSRLATKAIPGKKSPVKDILDAVLPKMPPGYTLRQLSDAVDHYMRS